MPQYANYAVVAQSGGNYPDPVSAMSALSTWCGTPSATNPCLLKIMPGVYNIGTNSLQMQSYVDVAGSGQNSTIINGNTANPSGVVAGVPNAEIRFLTVENTGGGNYAIALSTGGAGSGPAQITNVTLIASGGLIETDAAKNVAPSYFTNVTAIATNSGSAFVTGLYNMVSVTTYNVQVSVSSSTTNSNATGIFEWISASSLLNNVSITVSGGTIATGIGTTGGSTTVMNAIVNASGVGSGSADGIEVACDTCTVSIANSKITATAPNSFGLYHTTLHANATSSVAKIDHSIVTATESGVWNDMYPGVITYVGDTQIGGSVYIGSGSTMNCVGTYNATYAPITCP
jgi:hypothetical protein